MLVLRFAARKAPGGARQLVIWLSVSASWIDEAGEQITLGPLHGLMERHFGIFQGIPKAELAELNPVELQLILKRKNGESLWVSVDQGTITLAPGH